MGVLSVIFGMIKYIILVLFGVILNFYVQDPYIVAGASFLVSLVLFRQGKPKEVTPPAQQPIRSQRVQSLAPRTSGSFCTNCGARAKIEIPLIRHGKRQRIETLINEEALLLAKYIRKESSDWIPRIT